MRSALDAGDFESALAGMRAAPKPAGAWLAEAVAANPRDARAHWLLGNLEQDNGKLPRAIACYRRALRAEPRLVEAHNDLGTAYFANGWHSEAEQCYRRALEIEPDHAAATENLAAALRAQGKLREARNAFLRTLGLRVAGATRRLLGRKPRRTAAAPTEALAAQLAVLDTARRSLTDGKAAQAEREAREVLREAPDNPYALHLVGAALSAQGRFAEAMPSVRRAIELRSSVPEFYVTLGNLLADQREFDAALEQYRLALLLDPELATASANVARVLHQLGHFREAEEVYRLSLQSDPDLAAARANLAGTLLAMGRYAEAEATAREALEINPKLVHGHAILSGALMELGRTDDALRALREAERLEPGNAQVLRNLGGFEMTVRGDLEGAEALLRRAAALEPGDVEAHLKLARNLLIRERFAEGWEEYEWRRRDTTRMFVYRKLPYPEWDGSPLDGKSLLVNAEQGLGDEVMFASCFAEVARRARRMVVLCSRRLETLFRRSFPYAEVIGGSHIGDADPFPVLDGIDLQVAAGSLPRFLRRSAADFPAHTGYLVTDPGKVARWSQRLAALGPGPKVGLSWKGGTPLSAMQRRTLALEQLRGCIAMPGVHWISLQFGDTRAEREQFAARGPATLHHWQDAVDDLDETAALIKALDLRVSVCNTQVHLSGAQGLEAWVLTPFAPDWRYGHAGETMLWYPAARMYRQGPDRDWAPVVDRVRTDLSQRTGTP